MSQQVLQVVSDDGGGYWKRTDDCTPTSNTNPK